MTTKRLLNIAIASLLFFALATLGSGQKRENKVTADFALAELSDETRITLPIATGILTRRRSGNGLASGQSPHAEILSCSDSRVPPEVIFDKGLGDLFVVRVAGNVVSDTELGSLEYGAAHLHVPLLVVLGHQHCGAVSAAVDGGETEGHISALINLLRPAVEKTRELPGNHVENAVKANVEMVVKQLRTSTPVLAELVVQRN